MTGNFLSQVCLLGGVIDVAQIQPHFAHHQRRMWGRSIMIVPTPLHLGHGGLLEAPVVGESGTGGNEAIATVPPFGPVLLPRKEIQRLIDDVELAAKKREEPGGRLAP